jgi:uncharacterized protein DUF6011
VDTNIYLRMEEAKVEAGINPIEKLREQAERETSATSGTRRPSWGPALVLSGDLLETCRSLELLAADDKPVARLWAVFADPKKLGTWQRDNLSEVPLHGHRVRGFEVIAGEERHGHRRIYRTLKGENGRWDEGPRWVEPAPDNRIARCEIALSHCRRDLAEPVRDEAYWRAHYADSARYVLDLREQERRAAIQVRLSAAWRESQIKRLPALEAEHAALLVELDKQKDRYRLHVRAFELGRQRIAEFLGDPEAQMLAGSQVTGRCSRCGKGLTDPISIERGIGPECVQRVAWHKVVPDLPIAAPRPRPAPTRDLFGSAPAVAVAGLSEDDWMLPGE